MQEQYVSFSAAWFTLSLINAGLAQSKQRSGLNWWLISLLVGPLATLLIVAWPPAGTQASIPRETMTPTQGVVIAVGVVLFLVAALAVVAVLQAP